MKVLHIITGLETGGAEVMLAKLVLASRRCTHSVISLSDVGPVGTRLRSEGIEIQGLGLGRGPTGMSGVFRLAGEVRRQRPAVIQGWMNHGNLAAAAARALTGSNARLAWNIRQTLSAVHCDRWTTRSIIRLNARLSSRPDVIIYNSRAGAADHEAAGYRPDRRRIIPNGFDLAHFQPSIERRARVRSELGVTEGTMLIGLIARLNPWKNHAAFLEAASLVLRERPDVRFLFAGEGMSLDNPSMAEAIGDPRVLESSYFLGDRRDVADVTAALDIACNVSLGEGFANSIGEAMASGVPCVVTDVGDSRWIVDDTGMLCQGTDARSIFEGLRSMIDAGEAWRKDAGRRARRRIERHFSIDAVVDQYEAVYSGLAGDLPVAGAGNYGETVVSGKQA